MVEEARAVRERVLADLARRRALMQAQLDELRTGREQLLDAYRVVKQTLADAIAALGGVQAKAHAEGGIEIEAVPEDGIDFSLDAVRRRVRPRGRPRPDRVRTSRAAPDAPERSAKPPEVTGGGPGENPASGSAVDALFARLKEERAEPVPRPARKPTLEPDAAAGASTSPGRPEPADRP